MFPVRTSMHPHRSLEHERTNSTSASITKSLLTRSFLEDTALSTQTFFGLRRYPDWRKAHTVTRRLERQSLARSRSGFDSCILAFSCWRLSARLEPRRL